MARKNKQIKNKVLEIINEELMINEIFNTEIETAYRIINYSDYVVFQFKTNLGNEYDLEFHDSEESNQIQFKSGKTLADYNLSKTEKVKCLDIAFTISSVIDKEEPNEFEKETNLNEYHELFARMIYICKKEIQKDKKHKLYVIGYSRRNKNDIYLKIVENNFKNLLEIEHGISQYHPNGLSLFLIKI
jgi:hypothetical protein